MKYARKSHIHMYRSHIKHPFMEEYNDPKQNHTILACISKKWTMFRDVLNPTTTPVKQPRCSLASWNSSAEINTIHPTFIPSVCVLIIKHIVTNFSAAVEPHMWFQSSPWVLHFGTILEAGETNWICRIHAYSFFLFLSWVLCTYTVSTHPNKKWVSFMPFFVHDTIFGCKWFCIWSPAMKLCSFFFCFLFKHTLIGCQ